MEKTPSCRDSKKELAIQLTYIGNKTVKEIATELGIKPSTLTTWKGQEWFKRGIESYSLELRTLALKKLYNNVADALVTITDLLHAPSDAIRLRAATEILKLTKVDQLLPTSQPGFQSACEEIFQFRSKHRLSALETARIFESRGLPIPESLHMEIAAELRFRPSEVEGDDGDLYLIEEYQKDFKKIIEERKPTD